MISFSKFLKKGGGLGILCNTTQNCTFLYYTIPSLGSLLLTIMASYYTKCSFLYGLFYTILPVPYYDVLNDTLLHYTGLYLLLVGQVLINLRAFKAQNIANTVARMEFRFRVYSFRVKR